MAGERPGARAPAVARRAVPARPLSRRLLLRAPIPADPSPPQALDIEALEPFVANGGPIPEAGPVDTELGGVLARRVARTRALLARAERPALGLARAGRVLQRYTGADAAAYAKKWAKSTNSDYPRFVNDCTNFVSQALLAGGWTMVGGSCGDRTRDDVWWYGDWKCIYPGVRASRTWSGAQNLANFMSASGRGRPAAAVADLDIGDVLQMEFTGPGAYNPGRIGHTMIVTDKRNNDLFLSYHTSDHLDEPFWAPGGILSRYPGANYYAWKL